MDKNFLPRVLIVSHNCFSQSGANGRTLGNLFSGFPQNKLAQFYIVDEEPSWDICLNYFRVTDKNVMTFYRKDNFKIFHSNNGVDQIVKNNNKRKVKKSIFTLILRELVWKNTLWVRKSLKKWIEDFDPEVILFQVGNLGFLCDFVFSQAVKYNIPLVIYNTESYFFKKYDFTKTKLKRSILFNIYSSIYNRAYSKMMKRVKYAIYLTEDLEKLYLTKFDCESSHLFTTTNNFNGIITYRNDLQFSYLGNLDLGRYASLIDIANVLQSINNKYIINVYGTIENEQYLNELKNTAGVVYHGTVSYEDTIRIINTSDVNIYVEGFNEFFIEDSKYAFSTKIPDLLGAGKCIFAYAPEELSSTQYFIKNRCGMVVSKKSDLWDAMNKIVNDDKMRRELGQAALTIAHQNHDQKINSEKFKQILLKVKEKS